MNEYILQLASLDYLKLLMALGTVVVGSVVIKEALMKFCTTFGIEFSWIRTKRERKEYEKEIRADLDALIKRQENLERIHEEAMEARIEFNQNIQNNVNSLKDEIISMEKRIEIREAEKRFRKLRFDILNFADKISKSESVMAEMIDQIFEECSEYEELSKKYKFKNNRVNSSIKVIQKKYEELLLTGKILDGESD